MRRSPLRTIALLSLAALLTLSVAARGELAGSAGRPTTFRGELDLKDGNRCELSIQVERVGFLLTAVANKYRFVRMLADCRNQASLTLSSANDRLDAVIEKHAVPAVLSLQRSDSALWDALAANLRQTLAYPATIKPGAPVYLFAYFPMDEVKTMPEAFSFTIASVGQTVQLRNAAVAARP